MKKIISIILIFLLFANPLLALAADYYINCEDVGSSNLGTFSEPFKTRAAINAQISAAADGDDFWFAEGTTCNFSAKIDLDDINGVDSNNLTIFGCYDPIDSNVDDCDSGGLTRPIIDGSGMTVQNYVGLFDKTQKSTSTVQGYVRLQDLEIANSGGPGVYVEGPDPKLTTHAIEAGGSAEGVQFDIINCYIHDAKYAQIAIFWYRDGYIQNNITRGPPDYGDSTGNLTNLSLGGGNDNYECDDGDGAWDCMGASTGYLVSNNNISKCRECLTFGRYSTEHIAENNVIYDLRSGGVAIYINGAYNTTARYNLIYDDSNRGRSPGIWSNDEYEITTVHTNRGGHKIYGNLIAGMQSGVELTCTACSNGSNSWANYTNIKVYNNTLVDNDINIDLSSSAWSNQGTTSGHEIKNNISETNEAGTVHVDNASPTGVTWSNNHYDEDPGGTANDNAVIGDAALERTTSFYSLTLGAVTGQEFKLQDTGDADNAAVSITGYNNRIYTADFTASPPSLTTRDDSLDLDIGAWSLIGAAPKAIEGLNLY